MPSILKQLLRQMSCRHPHEYPRRVQNKIWWQCAKCNKFTAPYNAPVDI